MDSQQDWTAYLEAGAAQADAQGTSGAWSAALRQAWVRAREAQRGASAEWDGPMRFGMVGQSEPMQRLFDLLERVAPSEVSVLITGPTGAGKELVARALHEYSPRHQAPFLAENCAAVPENLLESELFGHVKGAFTGAVANRPGHFVAAEGGTVFLDEIGDMPLEMQAKLLRALETRQVRPVGSNKSVDVDFRLVAATHRDLATAAQEGRFRSDLYYRLNVVQLSVPALRERPEDIEPLAQFLLAEACRTMGSQATWTPAALEVLKAHPWPGNVRELKNVVQRAVALGGSELTPQDLGLVAPA